MAGSVDEDDEEGFVSSSEDGGCLAVAFLRLIGTRAVPKCGSSSAGTSMRGGGGGILVFLQQQYDKSSRVNSTRDNHDGCAILWRRCKVIGNVHARNAHAHTTTRRSSNSSRSPWIPK